VTFSFPLLAPQLIVVETENGCESLKMVSKIRFEQMVHEFPFGTFRPEKQDYLFRRSVGPVPLVHLLSNRNFRKVVVNGKQPKNPFFYQLSIIHSKIKGWFNST